MGTKLRLAAIADDYTGGSDLAGMLFQQGARTLQTFGLGTTPLPEGYDAIVVSLKTRSIAPLEARRQTREALQQLARLHPRQWQFKYCSTFDSTATGNIGPVIDLLLDELQVPLTVAVPALPVNGRKQYQGHLFVNGELLAESPLRHHPLNPMTDSNLVRHLSSQTRHRVGLVTLETVRQGVDAVQLALQQLEQSSTRIALVDAIEDGDLSTIARACRGLLLVTGGSGIGAAIARTWRKPASRAAGKPATKRTTLILSGSCSRQTLEQVARLQSSGWPLLRLRLGDLPQVLAQARHRLEAQGVAAIVSSAEAGQQTPGAALQIEAAFAELARQLPAEQVIVAGGETSGAVVQALGVRAVEITGMIDPGVPSLLAIGGRPIRLALKSGNFGRDDFFSAAIEHLERT